MNLKPSIAAQKLICEPFEKLLPQTDNLSFTDKQMFYNISSMPEDMETEEPKQAERLKKIKGYQHIEVMLKQKFTITLCFRTKLWLTHIMADRAVVGFIYLCYLQYKAKQNNVFEVPFWWVCEKLMPNGYVKHQQLSALMVAADPLFDQKYLESINYTPEDLKDYADAKQEAKGYGDDFKKMMGGTSITHDPQITKPTSKKFSAIDLMNTPGFLTNLNKKK